MAKKGFMPEQIINKLREAKLPINQGANVAIVSNKIGISAYNYYRWRKEYSGIVLMYSLFMGSTIIPR